MAVPEPATEPGIMPRHVRPAGRESKDRVTLPAKPFTLVTVIVETAVAPELTGKGDVAETEKSICSTGAYATATPRG